MKWLLLLVVCGLLLAVPAFGQTPSMEITWSRLLGDSESAVIPIPGQDNVIEISTPAEIDILAHVIWPGQEGQTYIAEQVSMHYWIWRNDDKSAKGDFTVSQILQPNDSFTVCNWFDWAEISTDKPFCTYFKVQADLKIKGVDSPLMSNELTFHLVPEPGSLGALATGLAGILGFAIRRRK